MYASIVRCRSTTSKSAVEGVFCEVHLPGSENLCRITPFSPHSPGPWPISNHIDVAVVNKKSSPVFSISGEAHRTSPSGPVPPRSDPLLLHAYQKRTFSIQQLSAGYSPKYPVYESPEAEAQHNTIELRTPLRRSFAGARPSGDEPRKDTRNGRDYG